MLIESLFLFFAAALLGGLVSTAPPGPLNIQLMLLYLQNKKKELLIFQSAIILTDFIICFFAFLIADQTLHAEIILEFQKNNSTLFSIIFIIFIFFLSIKFLVNSKKNKGILQNELKSSNIPTSNHRNLISSFLQGVVGTLTIPTLLPFWYLWWMGQNISSEYNIEYLILPIFFGVYIGDYAIFKLYRLLAFGLNKKIMQFKFYKVEAVVGYILLFTAGIFLFKLLYP